MKNTIKPRPLLCALYLTILSVYTPSYLCSLGMDLEISLPTSCIPHPISLLIDPLVSPTPLPEILPHIQPQLKYFEELPIRFRGGEKEILKN